MTSALSRSVPDLDVLAEGQQGAGPGVVAIGRLVLGHLASGNVSRRVRIWRARVGEPTVSVRMRRPAPLRARCSSRAIVRSARKSLRC